MIPKLGDIMEFQYRCVPSSLYYFRIESYLENEYGYQTTHLYVLPDCSFKYYQYSLSSRGTYVDTWKLSTLSPAKFELLLKFAVEVVDK